MIPLSRTTCFKILNNQVINLRQMCSLTHNYKLVVVGAGAGGLSVASRFCRTLPEGSVAIVEPNEVSIFSWQHKLYVVSYFLVPLLPTAMDARGWWN